MSGKCKCDRKRRESFGKFMQQISAPAERISASVGGKTETANRLKHADKKKDN